MDERSDSARWWMVGSLCVVVLVVCLDITIANVALPSISTALHATTAELQWITDSYALAFAAAMLPAGLLGDRYGRKLVLLGGLAIFAGASFWAALAGSAGALIAARSVMGLGAAVAIPLTLAIVAANFDDRTRPRAIAVITAAIALGLPLGPIVGGFLLQRYSWSSVFWINVPVAAIGLVAGVVLIAESRNERAPRPDLPGLVLVVASVVGLVYGVIEAPREGWTSFTTVAWLGGSVLLFVAFLAWQRRAPHKLVDPALFRNARFTWGTVAAVAVSLALFTILFFVPQYLQVVLGNDPLGTGLKLVPFMIGLLIAGGAAGVIDQRVGTKITVSVALVILAVGVVILGYAQEDSYLVAAVGLTVAGVGVGAAMAPALDAVTAEVGDEAGAGAAVTNTLRQVGGALAIAVLGSILAEKYADGVQKAVQGLPTGAAATASESVMGAAEVSSQLGAQGESLQAAAGSAYLAAMELVMWCTAVPILVTAALCLIYLPARSTHAAVADQVRQGAGRDT